MAYVRGYEYDVFVSYAHVDNVPTEPADYGWVDALVRILESGLNMKMGRRELAAIWRDSQSLRGNQEVTGHINEQVRRAALLVLIASPGYLSSRYCLAELETFCERALANRIFVVCKDPIDEARLKWPAEIRDLRKYNFWTPDRNHKPRVLGWPLPRHDSAEDRQLYYPKVDDLCADIIAALDDIGAAAVPAASAPATSAQAAARKGTILLAEVTDDLDARREEVRRYLDQAGIDVLPSGSYRLTRTEFEQAFAADLKSCKAFVQLLGPFAGKSPPDVPEGFGRFQAELARARGVPLLQWRSPDLDLATVALPAHLELLQAGDVHAMPFEEFKRSVVDLFAAAEPPRRAERPSFLFVNAADTDIDGAQSLVSDLSESLEWGMPLYDPSAKAEEIQSDIEAQLVDCDALVVLYGKANPRWVMSQLQLYRKLAPRRERDPRLLAVVNAPPEPKLPIPMKLQGLRTLSLAEAPEQIRKSLGP